jgi:hypothetical protein
VIPQRWPILAWWTNCSKRSRPSQCLPSVFSLSPWERAGVRASDRTFLPSPSPHRGEGIKTNQPYFWRLCDE